MKTRSIFLLMIGWALAMFAVAGVELANAYNSTPDSMPVQIVLRGLPKPPTLHYSIWRTAPLTVAEVFGRSQGCADASPDLIEMTARAALRASLDPAIAAATVAVESACNDYAISSRGAVGLMQVRPSVWGTKYDFSGTVNLFNEEDNVRVGAEIMAGLIHQYGTLDGVRRYNGTGTDCGIDCDGQYTTKILTLAHR